MKNTQQITRAMKFVSAARLRRAQEAALAARPYATELARVLRSTMARIEDPATSLAGQAARGTHPGARAGRGTGPGRGVQCKYFAGGREVHQKRQGKKIVVIPVGKKARDAFRKAGAELAGEYVNVLARVDFGVAREIANLVSSLYAEDKVDAVYAVFSEFKNVIAPNLITEKLLPVEKIESPGEPKEPAATDQIDYIYEQPANQILNRLLPRYVETQVLRALLESSAAEHAARMTAMEAATKNAGDVIEALTLHMNKVRQAAITKEIIEIVSGASSTA